MEKKYLNTVGIFECVVQEPGVDAAGKSFGWLALSKKQQTPCVHLRLTVAEGEHKGEITSTDLWLTEKAEDKTTARLVEVFGFDGDYKALQKSKGFAGMKCQIETEAEVGDDKKTRIKVKWLNPAGGGGKSKAPDDKKIESIFEKINVSRHKALAKTTKAALAAAAPKPAADSAPPKEATAEAPAGDGPPESDDVPF